MRDDRHTIRVPAHDGEGGVARHFEVVAVPPSTETETRQILLGVKQRYEEFHGVVFADDAIEAAIRASCRFLRHRYLPDRALDLLDEAGARAKVKHQTEPPEVLEALKRIKQHARAMENAIANHAFDKARHRSDEERKERENLKRLRQSSGPAEPPPIKIAAADIGEVIAERIGAPVDAVRRAAGRSGRGVGAHRGGTGWICSARPP
jgi:ATP-dependent Clp protease ATP-binding subunit ClpC